MKSRIPSSLLIVFFVCLGVRLIYFALFGNLQTAFGYEHGFGTQAIALISGKGLEIHDEYLLALDKVQAAQTPRLLHPTEYPPVPKSGGYYHATDMPGYPWILAGFWSLADKPSFQPVKLTQAILSALLIFPIWSIGRRLFGNLSGLIGAWLYAFWLPSAYLSQMITKEAWEAVFVVVGVWAALRYFEEVRKLDLIIAVLALICAAFLRTNLAVLIGTLAVGGLLCFPFRRCAIFFITSSVLLGACLVPWVLRNKQYVDSRIGVKEGFYWGIIGGMAMEDPDIAKRLTRLEGRKFLPDGTPNKFQREPPEVPEMTRKILRERPFWYLSVVAKRFITAPWFKLDWGYSIFPLEGQSFRLFKEKTGQGFGGYLKSYGFVLIFKLFSRGMELLIGTLSIAAFWFLRGQWKKCLWLAMSYWSLIAVYSLIHLEFRYIAPHLWVLLLLSAACIAKILETCQFQRLHSNP